MEKGALDKLFTVFAKERPYSLDTKRRPWYYHRVKGSSWIAVIVRTASQGPGTAG